MVKTSLFYDVVSLINIKNVINLSGKKTESKGYFSKLIFYYINLIDGHVRIFPLSNIFINLLSLFLIRQVFPFLVRIMLQIFYTF